VRPGLEGTGLPTDRRFTGQRREAGLGLYDYGARYYDPALGRFIQADTMVPSPANPQTLNRYAYTRNNPIKYNDPTGHDVGCGGYDCGSWEGQFSYARRHFPYANLSVVSMPTSAPTSTPTPTPTSDPTTTPNPQSNSQLILPINEPVYDNGYGFYPWNEDGSDFLHSGYDMHSASGDTTVVSMKAGTVVGVSQGKGNYWGVRVEEENHIIRHYVHVEIAEGIAVGKVVQAGTAIGNYGLYGDTTYPHLHFAIESPLLNPIDPAPYWLGGEPESWLGQWGSPRKPE